MSTKTEFLNHGAEELAQLSLRSGLVDKKLGVVCYHNCLMTPGPIAEDMALYDCDGNLIVGSPLNRGINVPAHVEVPVGKTIVEEPVFYIGALYSCWGHCLTDEIKFLWPFQTLARHPELRDCAIAYSTIECLGREIPENYLLLLEELGVVRDRLIEIKSPTVFKTCYFADECMWYDPIENKRYFTQEYSDMIESVCLRNRPPLEEQPRKVYFSRSSWQRWEYGEPSVEKAFARAGFTIVKPEKLRLHEMIRLLQNVDVFASSEGSCAHNALFLKRGARAIYLRKFDYANRYQLAIDEIKNLEAFYVDSYITFLFYDNNCKTGGPFFFYPNGRLKKLLGVSVAFPVVMFVRFVCWCLVLHYGHIVGELVRAARKRVRRKIA